MYIYLYIPLDTLLFIIPFLMSYTRSIVLDYTPTLDLSYHYNTFDNTLEASRATFGKVTKKTPAKDQIQEGH